MGVREGIVIFELVSILHHCPFQRLPSTRDDTALSYHLHVLTKLHLCMNGSTFRVKTE